MAIDEFSLGLGFRLFEVWFTQKVKKAAFAFLASLLEHYQRFFLKVQSNVKINTVINDTTSPS